MLFSVGDSDVLNVDEYDELDDGGVLLDDGVISKLFAWAIDVVCAFRRPLINLIEFGEGDADDVDDNDSFSVLSLMFSV
jgi:hypothetical protein